MKRMVLVPEQALNRYEQRQRLETYPIMANMLHKDTQMSNILQRDDVTIDEKQKLFNADLERFLELRRQKNYQVPTDRMVDIEEQQGILIVMSLLRAPIVILLTFLIFAISLTYFRLYLSLRELLTHPNHSLIFVLPIFLIKSGRQGYIPWVLVTIL